MGATRIAGMGWLARGVPVAAVTVLAVAGMAGGGASAVAAVAAPPTPGTISTVAGGVGGPARATNVPLSDPCGVSVANGLLYIADNETVRQVDSTDRLTTPAGTGPARRWVTAAPRPAPA